MHYLEKNYAEIAPKKVFLVHTERPALYKRYISDLGIREIVCPEEGKIYSAES